MMTNSLFVDTSGWMAFALSSDAHHALAVRELNEAITKPHIRIYTTDHVIAELVALMTTRGVPRQRVLQEMDKILIPRRVQKLYTDEPSLLAAWTLLKSRPDKDWSLVDAISMQQMQQLGITEALMNDHHFEQAGLVRLLK